MSRFLDHAQVRDAVQEIVARDNVRCAVAFWDGGALNAFFLMKKRVSDARIICDLTTGGTNPMEMELLGGPINPKLKHV